MIYLFIISLTIFILYNIYVIKEFGIPESISDSYYRLRNRGHKATFTLFCWITSFPLLIYWIERYSTDWDFLPFVSCVGLMFVGTAPAFKDFELERKVHSIAAIICLIASYVWSLFFGSIFLSINFIFLTILLYYLLKKNKIYWIEIVAFSNIYLQLLL